MSATIIKRLRWENRRRHTSYTAVMMLCREVLLCLAVWVGTGRSEVAPGQGLDSRLLELRAEIALLQEAVAQDKVEIREWTNKLDGLADDLANLKEENAEVRHTLSRRKRGVVDPMMGYFVGGPGDRGAPGLPGIPGKPGRVGDRGLPGVPGKQGLRGPMGPYGPPGYRGPYGFEGPVGEKGERGGAGFDGYPGLVGSYGAVGHRGQHGHQGPHGPQGFMGFAGMPGDPGPYGERGIPGPPGIPGPHGSYGLPGGVGVYGDGGPQGELGNRGPTGNEGPKGAQGERGPEGDIGEWGPAGLPGLAYNPYAMLYLAAPMSKVYTDCDEDKDDCSDGDVPPPPMGMPVSKVAPAMRHPPPGAQVVFNPPPEGAAAPPLPGKSFMAQAPMFAKHMVVYAPPPAGEPEVDATDDLVTIDEHDFADDDKDITSPDDFDE